MSLPLVETYILGVFAILAGASFMLPNRMRIIYKAPIGILSAVLGALYIYMTFVPMTEAEKAPIIRIILLSLVTCILVSNVAGFMVAYFVQRGIDKAGITDRRHHDSN